MKATKFPPIVYLGALLLLLLDVSGSNTRVYRYLHTPSYIIALCSLFFLVVIRFGNYTILSMAEKLNTFFILPVTLIFAIFLTLWDAFSPPNYVFSQTHLQHGQILLISIFSCIVFFLSRTNKWFIDNLYPCIFSGAFIYLGFASLAALLPFDVFLIASHEDGVVEYLQFSALVLSALCACKIALGFHKQKMSLQTGVFALLCLFFVFVAGDELAWGQRLFHMNTPTVIEEYNVQGEITVHNLSFFHNLVDWGFMLIGFLGMSMWYIFRLFPKLQKVSLRRYLPHWSYSSYFFFGFLYYASTLPFPMHRLGKWSESAELMIYTGLMFAVLIPSSSAPRRRGGFQEAQ